jgi:hypothetical protein
MPRGSELVALLRCALEFIPSILAVIVAVLFAIREFLTTVISVDPVEGSPAVAAEAHPEQERRPEPDA